MPSQRRVRVLFYVILAAVITTLLFTSHLRKDADTDPRTIQDFYHKTMRAMDKQSRSTAADAGPADARGQTVMSSADEDDAKAARAMAARLKAAEQQAKDSANAKAPRPDAPSKINGVGSSADGQDKKLAVDVASSSNDRGAGQQDHDVEAELNTILRKAPVIIFSKTTCPHCTRAKKILLEKYEIDPPPHIVELDKHPLGKPMQAKLAEMTGRRTVPNIMVNGKSIGGADRVTELDKAGTLVSEIESLGVASGPSRLRMKERVAGGSLKQRVTRRKSRRDADGKQMASG